MSMDNWTYFPSRRWIRLNSLVGWVQPNLHTLNKGKMMTIEEVRLQQEHERKAYWRRWGPYLSERQWGTVREDYSPYGSA